MKSYLSNMKVKRLFSRELFVPLLNTYRFFGQLGVTEKRYNIITYYGCFRHIRKGICAVYITHMLMKDPYLVD